MDSLAMSDARSEFVLPGRRGGREEEGKGKLLVFLIEAKVERSQAKLAANLIQLKRGRSI